MQDNSVLQSSQSAALEHNKVLRNTYWLLAMTLGFSAVVAGVSMAFALPPLHWLVFLVGAYGLMFLIQKNRYSGTGVALTFVFTGLMGYSLGPILNLFLSTGGSDIVMTALGGTALAFFGLSAYAMTTKRDLSFINGMIFVGFWVLLFGIIANLFLQLPALHMALSAMFILFSSGAILLQTQEIVRGGETSYISATLTLYVSIYNIFVSLLTLLGGNRE